MKVDLEKFSGDSILHQMLVEAQDLINRCRAFVDKEMPPVTYSTVKAHAEIADKLLSELTDSGYNFALAYHINAKNIRRRRRDVMEEAVCEYNRSKWHCETHVEGDAQVCDLQEVLDCIGSIISTFDKLHWLVKDCKDKAIQMYEKTR